MIIEKVLAGLVMVGVIAAAANGHGEPLIWVTVAFASGLVFGYNRGNNG